MATLNYAFKEISCKLVFYGCGLCGKTTNLQNIHSSVPGKFRGELVSLATEQDRTLFFDFLPLDLGEVKGFKTKFQLYTVPGQVYYNATRKLVLRGVDGLVLVVDSQRDRLQENLDSFNNLKENLKEYGYSLEEIPWVIQYNKRDMPDVMSIEELEKALNPYKVPYYEAVAYKGVGVRETLKGISGLVIRNLSQPGTGIGGSASPVADSPLSKSAALAAAKQRAQEDEDFEAIGDEDELDKEIEKDVTDSKGGTSTGSAYNQPKATPAAAPAPKVAPAPAAAAPAAAPKPAAAPVAAPKPAAPAAAPKAAPAPAAAPAAADAKQKVRVDAVAPAAAAREKEKAGSGGKKTPSLDSQQACDVRKFGMNVGTANLTLKPRDGADGKGDHQLSGVVSFLGILKKDWARLLTYQSQESKTVGGQTVVFHRLKSSQGDPGPVLDVLVSDGQLKQVFVTYPGLGGETLILPQGKTTLP